MNCPNQAWIFFGGWQQKPAVRTFWPNGRKPARTFRGGGGWLGQVGNLCFFVRLCHLPFLQGVLKGREDFGRFQLSAASCLVKAWICCICCFKDLSCLWSISERHGKHSRPPKKDSRETQSLRNSWQPLAAVTSSRQTQEENVIAFLGV